MIDFHSPSVLHTPGEPHILDEETNTELSFQGVDLLQQEDRESFKSSYQSAIKACAASR